MKHTKDEVILEISKKDKVYLSIFICLLLITICVCILVPRYYALQNNNSTNQNPPNNTGGGTNTPNNPSQPENNNPENVNANYINYYSTQVLNAMKSAGMPYSNFARYLDSYNILDVHGLELSEQELSTLETLAQPIYSAFQNEISAGNTITATLIDSNDDLHSQIITFTNYLNTIAEN